MPPNRAAASKQEASGEDLSSEKRETIENNEDGESEDSVDVQHMLDDDDIDDYLLGGERNNADALFPEIRMEKIADATWEEEQAVQAYIRIRDVNRAGPYFADLSDDSTDEEEEGWKQFETKLGKKLFDPFNDQPMYTQQYRAVKQTAPRFSEREHDLRIFPLELWDTVDPNWRRKPQYKADAESEAETKPGRKRDFDELSEDEEEPENDDQGKSRVKRKRVREGSEDANPKNDNLDDDDEGEEELDPEDNFSDDDSDFGGDYNAERYFDDGGDDADLGGDNGGYEDGGYD